MIHTEKLSISLPGHLTQFINSYKTAHHCKSRSEVIQAALLLLRQQQLATFYQEAGQEIDTDFDITDMDGLSDETW